MDAGFETSDDDQLFSKDHQRPIITDSVQTLNFKSVQQLEQTTKQQEMVFITKIEPEKK